MFKLLKKSIALVSAFLILSIGVIYNNCGVNEEEVISSLPASSPGCDFSEAKNLDLAVPYKSEDKYDDEGALLIRLDHSFITSEFIEKIEYCQTLDSFSSEYLELECAEIQNDEGYPYNQHYGWHYDPTEQYIANPKYTFTDGQPIFPYYSMSDGCVTRVQIDNPIDSEYVDSNVSVLVSYGKYSVVYLFEPQGTVDEQDSYTNIKYVQDTQLSLVNVKVGQKISKGDLIGHLYIPEKRDYLPTMHFHVAESEINCPSSYFSNDALSETIDLLNESHTDRKLCYDD